MDSGKICLRVKDSGEGFDSHPAEPAEGLGLANMRERARLVGGRMIVSSLPSKGTRIEVIVPMDLSKEGSA
jgi:signal transduction histidine kinase